jgi:hypothetical protein
VDISSPIYSIGDAMLAYEAFSVFASVISSLSRAGLNVVDRKQFQNEKICPLVIGYWNNFLPIILLLPAVFIAPNNTYFLRDIFSIEIVIFAILIQCVAFSFSYSFRVLRVTDIGILSKVADITVPISIAAFGYYLNSLSLFLFLPALLLIFVLSAGLNVVKKFYKSSTALVLALTAQGIYAFFWGSDLYIDREFWGLLSIAFSILVWRFTFSGLLLIHRGRFSFVLFPSKELLFNLGFYLRGFLTALTQVTFILAISTNNLMIVWPILNTTSFAGTVMAYVFLGEKLFPRDVLYAITAMSLSGLILLILHNENNFRNYS